MTTDTGWIATATPTVRLDVANGHPPRFVTVTILNSTARMGFGVYDLTPEHARQLAADLNASADACKGA